MWNGDWKRTEQRKWKLLQNRQAPIEATVSMFGASKRLADRSTAEATSLSTLEPASPCASPTPSVRGEAAMKASRETHAMEYLQPRTLTTWSAAPTYSSTQALINLHPRLCGPIPRYALLRLAIGGESDCWFRRHFHKLGEN